MWRPRLSGRLRLLKRWKRPFTHYRFNSITRRIFVLNFFGVAVLVAGILYLNEGRVKFTQTRVDSLSSQAAIIATAIAQVTSFQGEASGDLVLGREASKVDAPSPPVLSQDLSMLSFRINPEMIAPMLRDLVGATKTRARIYDTEGNLLLDSLQVYSRGEIGTVDGSPLLKRGADPLTSLLAYFKRKFFDLNLPSYEEKGMDGKAYDEVRIALTGSPAPMIRLTGDSQTVISVGMPIQRHKAVLGALMLTAQGSDIDGIIAAEHWQVVQVAGLVVFVTGFLSFLLAQTIAGPMRRLALAAERVRRNIKAREQIPDFSNRSDEIGELSGALREMTNALYLRIDAIESFAADVSHELKNPLTSLRGAAGMLGFVKHSEDRDKLVDIIQHDVRRLDRLITDIADASRLDSELVRETARPVNMASLLCALCEITRDSRAAGALSLTISLRVQGCTTPEEFDKSQTYSVNGHDSRLSQVVINLLDNAMSFSPRSGTIHISLRPVKNVDELEIAVEDCGPGIPADNLVKIFDRFYTDRPEPESFGQNSGLGLNISQQIVKAHNGRIWAENRTSPDPIPFKTGPKRGKSKKGRAVAELSAAKSLEREEVFACGATPRRSYGARFVIRLPAMNPFDD